MKKLFFIFLFVLISGAAFADLTLVQKVHSGGMMGQPPMDDTMTMQIKGNKARIDFQTKKISEVVDLEAHKMYVIDHDKRQVMVMSTDAAGSAMDMMSKMAGGNMKSDVQKSGKTDTVNGFKCEEYIISTTGPMAMNMTSCLTQDIEAKEYEPFRNFGQEMMKMLGAEKLAQMKGVPVRTTMKMNLMGQSMDSSTELKSAAHSPLPASIFDIPKDYEMKEMQMPNQPHP